ncbi:MAG: pentapeptide repeat-containing protein [Gammaproteobacteria bacterium]|nr:pentapeptide repeat-containing protein [Gammaproteobacteria bacterium]
MALKQVWYTRRNKEIRGPFPQGMITRYILLGRILETDELSSDQCMWVSVNNLPELIPDEMKLDLSIKENAERLRIVRLREDERLSDDRRRFSDETQGDQVDSLRYKRSGVERRESEPLEILRHRELKTKFMKSLSKPSNENYLPRITALTFILLGALWFAFIESPTPYVILNNCNIPPAPKVNWNNCRLQGATITAVNLAGAKMHSTYLFGADLTGSIFANADMAYVDLVNANAQNANFQNADLEGAVMRNINLENAKLSNANLRYALLQGANLKNADLTGADLTLVDLNGANITNVNLTGAKLDKVIWIDNSICAPESVGQCISLNKKLP